MQRGGLIYITGRSKRTPSQRNTNLNTRCKDSCAARGDINVGTVFNKSECILKLKRNFDFSRRSKLPLLTAAPITIRDEREQLQEHHHVVL